MSKKKILRCNLSLLIAAIISMLLVALGFAITAYTYENQKKTALESTEKIFDISSMHIEEKLFNLIHSVESIVAMSSVLESLGVGGEENMSMLLPYFKQSFRKIPWMESFYVGYGDGSFFMIQALRENKNIRMAVAAPVQAAYAVKSIAPVADGGRQPRAPRGCSRSGSLRIWRGRISRRLLRLQKLNRVRALNQDRRRYRQHENLRLARLDKISAVALSFILLASRAGSAGSVMPHLMCDGRLYCWAD